MNKETPLFAAPRPVARRGPPPQAAGAASDDAMSRRTPLKTAGGTEELHSRASNERPGRPCPRAALSGRRAAQDGQFAALGGPERAGVKRSGEGLSAGRAAAPDQVQLGALGRGRSAARVTRASAQRAKPAELVGPVEARPCERAGSAAPKAMVEAVV